MDLMNEKLSFSNIQRLEFFQTWKPFMNSFLNLWQANVLFLRLNENLKGRQEPPPSSRYATISVQSSKSWALIDGRNRQLEARRPPREL